MDVGVWARDGREDSFCRSYLSIEVKTGPELPSPQPQRVLLIRREFCATWVSNETLEPSVPGHPVLLPLSLCSRGIVWAQCCSPSWILAVVPFCCVYWTGRSNTDWCFIFHFCFFFYRILLAVATRNIIQSNQDRADWFYTCIDIRATKRRG